MKGRLRHAILAFRAVHVHAPETAVTSVRDAMLLVWLVDALSVRPYFEHGAAGDRGPMRAGRSTTAYWVQTGRYRCVDPYV